MSLQELIAATPYVPGDVDRSMQGPYIATGNAMKNPPLPDVRAPNVGQATPEQRPAGDPVPAQEVPHTEVSSVQPLAGGDSKRVVVRFSEISTSSFTGPNMARSVSVSELHAVQQMRPINQSRVGLRIPFVSRQHVITTTVPVAHLPEPVYLEGDDGRKFGMRCVCGKTETSEMLVQCDKCQNWLHGQCVCVARTTAGEPFWCPFCLGRVLNCPKGDNGRWDIPIVQCSRCRSWVHKACQDLEFGIVPDPFLCTRCGGKEFALPQPCMDHDAVVPNKISFFECNKYELLRDIPEGMFRSMVVADFDKSEVNLHDEVGVYFQFFAQTFFERNHDFWRCFVDTFATIFACEKQLIMDVIDAYAVGLLYRRGKPVYSNIPTRFNISESIRAYVDGMNMPRMEQLPPPVELYVGKDGFVHTRTAVEEGQFICDLPGFCLHTDEVKADEGIPKTCIVVTETSAVVDMEHSSFTYAHQLARSFHYNAVAKLYRLGDEPRVGLFATRLKGPLSEEKGKRGAVIAADKTVYLPLDGEIPFATPKVEWKEKRSKVKPIRVKVPVPERSGRQANRKKAQQKSRSVDNFPVLSLLTAFCEDIVPPMPIVVLTEKELEEKNRQENSRTRGGRMHRRQLSDGE